MEKKFQVEICGWCSEEIKEGEQRAGVRDPFHVECLIRSVVGSVGHQRHTCSCYGGNEDDPPGMTPRQAALAAYELFRNSAAAHR